MSILIGKTKLVRLMTVAEEKNDRHGLNWVK